jgi:hypothetical protein
MKKSRLLFVVLSVSTTSHAINLSSWSQLKPLSRYVFMAANKCCSAIASVREHKAIAFGVATAGFLIVYTTINSYVQLLKPNTELLCRAVKEKNRFRTIKLMNTGKVDMNAQGADGSTLLQIAISTRQDWLICKLIGECNLKTLNAVRPSDGQTALHLAVLQLNVDAVRNLLAKGADRGILNKDQKSPYDLAKTQLDLAKEQLDANVNMGKNVAMVELLRA